MQSRLVLALGSLAWLACTLLASADDDKKSEATRVARAKAMIEALFKEEFDKAGKDFDEAMKKALPPEKLKDIPAKYRPAVGAFRKLLGTRTQKIKQYDIVFVTCEFEKVKLVARVVFDKDGKITGLFFRPADEKDYTYKAPPYARADSFREREVIVGEGGEWPLPGTLSVPIGKGRLPAVVLLHGSGPHDRDETVLANKPLRDIAWGLASQGIAVLRFVKRTQLHGEKWVKSKVALTFRDEVVDDALLAATLLRKQKEIDPKRVFVLGHSLGAVCAPAVGEKAPDLAGLVLLAGNTRPLEDVYLEQILYFSSLKDKLTDEDKKELEKIRKQVKRAKEPNLSPDTPREELPLGMPAPYVIALRAYDQAATAAKLKMPMLVLQGERDYQVTMADFAGWKKALAGRKNVTFKSYPALNHLFMEGKGKSRPEEYYKAGHVSKEVIDDVAAWMKKH
jgi:dienelactone hydrolase